MLLKHKALCSVYAVIGVKKFFDLPLYFPTTSTWQALRKVLFLEALVSDRFVDILPFIGTMRIYFMSNCFLKRGYSIFILYFCKRKYPQKQ